MTDVKHMGPRRGPLARLLGRSVLKGLGWTLVGDFPPMPKAVFIAAPHTSNMDGVLMVATAFAMGLKLSWLGKDSLFQFPFGPAFRALGGISVDRSKSNDMVQQVADAFAASPGMYLAIAPSASRTQREHWKSGFYYIALKADVPLLCGCIDYATKQAGIIGVVQPTGSESDDMERIRAIYEGRMGKHPERMTPMRLPCELEEKRASPQTK